MTHDEFAFLNEQLGHMLRDGMPLEGALAALGRDMARGALRAEVEALRADLARGLPLDEAVAARALPELYKQMIRVGVASNDLPGVLLMVADHYRRSSSLWDRLKGMMLYPAVVLALAFGLSLFLAFWLGPVIAALRTEGFWDLYCELEWWQKARLEVVVVPPLLLGLVAAGLGLVVWVPRLRRRLGWRVPPFREASLVRVASSLAVLLRGGCRLADALRLVSQIERGTRAEGDLAHIADRAAEGYPCFAGMAKDTRVLPPLFVWLVCNSREDPALGFERAAALYRTRAAHRTEALLYAALPVAILLVGGVVLAQLYLVASRVLPSMPFFAYW